MVIATSVKRERAEMSVIIGIAAAMMIFGYVLSQIHLVIEFLSSILAKVSFEESYFHQLLKMLGIAYAADFASSICKDSGYQSVSGMIELFAKISIVALSIPGIMFLVDTLEQFV